MDIVNPQIEHYCRSISHKPSALADELAEYTRQNVPGSGMLIGPLEASFLISLIRLGHLKHILEIGTYTGYSALCMAEHLPSDGRIITLDINKDTTEVAQQYWQRSPHHSKIHLILGPGLESIKKLKGSFDLVFIDADKANYLNYLEACLPLLSPRGVIVADNCLWGGEVLDEMSSDKQTRALRNFNEHLANRQDLWVSLLPIRDGILLAQRRSE